MKSSVPDILYDSRRHPVREQVSAGRTVRTVTSRSFLDRGLPECATVRMKTG